MQNTFVQSLIRGTPQDKVVKDFAKKMNTSLSQAGRLIATETTYFTTQGEFDSLNNLGVKQYEILATLDRKTSDICRHLDGKIFNMSDKKIGITAPPFHCWCRSCIIPHTPKLKGSKRAARNDEGKTYYIDGNMKYEDWKKVFVDKSMNYKSWQDTQKNGTIKETKPSGQSEWKFKPNGSIIPTEIVSKKVHFKTKIRYIPNAVIMHYGADNQHDYDFYDNKGFCILQIHCGGHGNLKRHPFGIKGEHAADWNWIFKDDKWQPRVKKNRELTDEERRWMNDSFNNR